MKSVLKFTRLLNKNAYSVFNRFASTLVLAEHNDEQLNLITLNAIHAASRLGDVSVLVTGANAEKVAEQVGKAEHVQKVFVAQNDRLKHQLPELVTEVVLALQSKQNFNYIVASASSFSRGVIPRVAAKCDVEPMSDVCEIYDGETFTRPTYAGNAMCKFKTLASLKLMTVRTTSFQPVKADGGSGQIEKAPEADLSFDRSEFVSQQVHKSERPDLQGAKVVVSGGRGVGSMDNFKLVFDLAGKLNAAVGASRAAVDAGYVPNDLQVGQTGKVVAPDLYIAIGISGAIQHISGMKDSKVIVAINKDPDAPIFEIADIGLKADLFKAIPELIEAL